MFKVVQSIEVFSATVENLNGDGNSVHSREYLGDFETKRAAEQVLADYGFTHKDRNGYRDGSRILHQFVSRHHVPENYN